MFCGLFGSAMEKNELNKLALQWILVKINSKTDLPRSRESNFTQLDGTKCSKIFNYARCNIQ